MKHCLAIIAALLLGGAPAVAHAQLGLGIKGGLSYGNVSNRGVLPGNLEARSGFAVGASVAFPGEPLGLGVEALYAQRGVRSATDGAARKLDYVDVPAYVRVRIPLPAIAPFAYAGPQLSFELRCHDGSGACPDTDRPKTTYAGVIGAGVRIGALGNVSVEGRYIYGLTDLKLNTVTSPESYQTRSFAILGGIGF